MKKSFITATMQSGGRRAGQDYDAHWIASHAWSSRLPAPSIALTTAVIKVVIAAE